MGQGSGHNFRGVVPNHLLYIVGSPKISNISKGKEHKFQSWEVCPCFNLHPMFLSGCVFGWFVFWSLRLNLRVLAVARVESALCCKFVHPPESGISRKSNQIVISHKSKHGQICTQTSLRDKNRESDQPAHFFFFNFHFWLLLNRLDCCDPGEWRYLWRTFLMRLWWLMILRGKMLEVEIGVLVMEVDKLADEVTNMDVDKVTNMMAKITNEDFSNMAWFLLRWC